MLCRFSRDGKGKGESPFSLLKDPRGLLESLVKVEGPSALLPANRPTSVADGAELKMGSTSGAEGRLRQHSRERPVCHVFVTGQHAQEALQPCREDSRKPCWNPVV